MNFYDILELGQSATDDDIRRNFRRLARQYHPDVSDDPEAEERFQLVYIAYEILNNKDKRAIYDDLQVLKRARQRFTHEADVRAWSRSASRKARAYADMSFEEFHETFLSKLSFHSSQVVAFMLFFLLLCAGITGIMAGSYFVFDAGFNGAKVFGYILWAFGGGFSFISLQALWGILQFWRA